MEGVLQEKNFISLIAIGILIMLAFALAFVVFFNYSQKKILREQMEVQKLAFKHQEELLHSNILTQEAERKRIARDLHDEIGSKLNVIYLNIHRLKELGKSEKQITTITDEVEAVINTTINSTRQISHELLPPVLEEFGLVEAINELQHSYNRLGSIHIYFTAINDENHIGDKLIELNLFRVIQELINNSLKHGESTEISIKLWIQGPSVKLIYEDNGSGFDISQLASKRGLGMKNIESRLGMIHAKYHCNSSPGNGVKVVVELCQNEATEKLKI
jgi:signal transduction histidine kinase